MDMRLLGGSHREDISFGRSVAMSSLLAGPGAVSSGCSCSGSSFCGLTGAGVFVTFDLLPQPGHPPEQPPVEAVDVGARY